MSSHLLGEQERICDGVVLIEAGRLIRAEQLGDVTLATGTLIVEIDGDSRTFAETLLAAGIDATLDRTRVLIALRDADTEGSMQVVCDAVRDAAAAQDAGLLRLERHRGHLEDLFIETTHV